jgi:RsiW-degrading membrane proteinase PrsW (M82 family)
LTRFKKGNRARLFDLPAVFAILAVVFLSLVVFALFTVVLSPSADGSLTWNIGGVIIAVIATLIAFVPALIYVLPFMWLDRYDPEPLWLIALAFAWGALVAVLVSFVLNTGIGIGVAVAVGGEKVQSWAILSAP